jgi:signal transduction histidine kinase
MKHSGSHSTKTAQLNTYPEVADALRNCGERVVQQWRSMAQRHLAEIDELAFQEFTEKLPKLLKELANVLATSHELCQPIPNSVDYETYRLRSQLDLPGLFSSYDLLRTAMLDELPKELGRSLNTEETLAVCTGTEIAVRCHLVAFIEHQKREFQAVSQARSMYLSFMAHDLRSGLNSVVMLTELLAEQLAGHEQFASSLADLQAVRSNIQSTVGAMNRFLKGEQLRNKKIVVSKVSVDFRELIQNIVAQFQPEARAKNLDLIFKVPEQAVGETDRELVLVILQNLVSNAVKYANKGTIEIGVSEEPSGWKLSVRDEGPGIPQNRLDKIFEPFTRGETYGQQGIGLGLSIALHAAEALEAKLWAESQVGKGTTFHLQLRH